MELAMRVLMVGFSKDFLSRLCAHHRVVVIEEPEIFAKRGLADACRDLPCVERIVLARYQQADEFLAAGERAARARGGFDAVAPGVEYAVPAAAALAGLLALPGATDAAAATLRDKLLLREAASRAGVPCPEWTEIRGPGDITSFAAGGPVVIKPANRQASVGVNVLDDARYAEQAWADMVAARETTQVSDRALHSRYLAERRLSGSEYSVEALVRDGRILFHNVTEKATLGGRHPVELGHVVPAQLDAAHVEALRFEMRRLIAAVGFGTGMLHAEWMLTAQGPVLIECAGRAPGDRIVQLIDLAYGTQLFPAYLDLLAGRPLDLPERPRRSAAIRFISAPPGTVVDVVGADAARDRDGVAEVAVSAAAGASLQAPRSSWDRCGHVIVTARDPAAARALAAETAASVHVVTERAAHAHALPR